MEFIITSHARKRASQRLRHIWKDENPECGFWKWFETRTGNALELGKESARTAEWNNIYHIYYQGNTFVFRILKDNKEYIPVLTTIWSGTRKRNKKHAKKVRDSNWAPPNS